MGQTARTAALTALSANRDTISSMPALFWPLAVKEESPLPLALCPWPSAHNAGIPVIWRVSARGRLHEMVARGSSSRL